MYHRVFVSSTFVDLARHREIVRETIRQLGAIDIAMEHFGATDERPKDTCVREVQEGTDSFIGIYAHRYGHIPKRANKSITELEYDAAVKAKVEKFIYLVDDEVPWLPRNVDKGEPAIRLGAFKKRLKERHGVRRFSSPEELGRKVAADLGKHLIGLELTRVQPSGAGRRTGGSARGAKFLSERRSELYAEHRKVFLVHLLSPSTVPGQEYDVFIYLKRHNHEALDDVAYAEFFLGPSWGNGVFRVNNERGLIGISTAAWGEFLCICNVVFKDGAEILLERYIDFGADARNAQLAASESEVELPSLRSSRSRPKASIKRKSARRSSNRRP